MCVVCVCVSLFSAGFCDLWGEFPVLGGVGLAQRRLQETLRGLSFLSLLSDFNDSNERMERRFSRMSQEALAVRNEKQENWRTMFELLLGH